MLRFPSSTKASGQSLLHQVVFFNQVSSVLNQHKQGFGNLRSQRNGRAVAHQDALLGVQAKRTERVEVLGLQRHSDCHKFAGNLPEIWKDFETATELRCATSGDGCGLESRPAQILVRPSAPPQNRMSLWRPVRLGMAPRRWPGTAFLPTNRRLKGGSMKSKKWTSVVVMTLFAALVTIGSSGNRVHTCQRHSSKKRLLPNRSQP